MDIYSTILSTFFPGCSPDEFDEECARIAATNVTPKCRTVWKNEYFYRCRTCGLSAPSSICVSCFRAGPHEAEGHDYSFEASVFGGCCDCGHAATWRPEGNCSHHNGREMTTEEALGCLAPELAHAAREDGIPLVSEQLNKLIPPALEFTHSWAASPAAKADIDVCTLSLHCEELLGVTKALVRLCSIHEGYVALLRDTFMRSSLGSDVFNVTLELDCTYRDLAMKAKDPNDPTAVNDDDLRKGVPNPLVDILLDMQLYLLHGSAYKLYFGTQIYLPSYTRVAQRGIHLPVRLSPQIFSELAVLDAADSPIQRVVEAVPKSWLVPPVPPPAGSRGTHPCERLLSVLVDLSTILHVLRTISEEEVRCCLLKLVHPLDGTAPAIRARVAHVEYESRAWLSTFLAETDLTRALDEIAPEVRATFSRVAEEVVHSLYSVSDEDCVWRRGVLIPKSVDGTGAGVINCHTSPVSAFYPLLALYEKLGPTKPPPRGAIAAAANSLTFIDKVRCAFFTRNGHVLREMAYHVRNQDSWKMHVGLLRRAACENAEVVLAVLLEATRCWRAFSIRRESPAPPEPRVRVSIGASKESVAKFLALILAIVTGRPSTDRAESEREEVVHALAASGSVVHSSLVQYANEERVMKILEDVAVFKPSEKVGEPGTFKLRKAAWAEVDPHWLGWEASQVQKAAELREAPVRDVAKYPDLLTKVPRLHFILSRCLTLQLAPDETRRLVAMLPPEVVQRSEFRCDKAGKVRKTIAELSGEGASTATAEEDEAEGASRSSRAKSRRRAIMERFRRQQDRMAASTNSGTSSPGDSGVDMDTGADDEVDEDEELCFICLEPGQLHALAFVDEERVLTCNHKVHEKCYASSSGVVSDCPICKRMSNTLICQVEPALAARQELQLLRDLRSVELPVDLSSMWPAVQARIRGAVQSTHLVVSAPISEQLEALSAASSLEEVSHILTMWDEGEVRRSPPRLMLDLPETLQDLLHRNPPYEDCVQCGKRPKFPALCLQCGTWLCSRSECCGGECYKHAVSSSCTLRLYFLAQSTYTLVLHAGLQKAALLPSLYVDAYGEPDPGLRRGKRLSLSKNLEASLQLHAALHSWTYEPSLSALVPVKKDARDW